MGDAVVGTIDVFAREATLFAATGFLLGGPDDLLIDLIWLIRRGFVRRRWIDRLPAPAAPLRLAIFVPVWREDAVIGAMLRTALSRIDHADYRTYVGCYPNDAATIAAVAAVAADDARVRPVIGPREGPTSKGDNLNSLWRALGQDERAEPRTVAVILHDAEDVVAADAASPSISAPGRGARRSAARGGSMWAPPRR